MKAKKLPVLLMVIIFAASLAFAAPAAAKNKKNKVPAGFKAYRVKPGDTLVKIAPRPNWRLIKKVNKIDRLYAGRIILLPVDLGLARQYCPAPKKIAAFGKIKKIILINVHPREQWFGAYGFGQLIHWGPISSGRRGRRTPTGAYWVRWKAKKYYSKKYDADMPYSLCISNKIGLFIHQQQLPGRPASHGCIRLLRADAKWLFFWAEIKTPVLIISQPTAGKKNNNGQEQEKIYLAID